MSYVWFRSTVNNIPFDLNDLAEDVRFFVQEYRKGHRGTNRLITRECLETRMHVSTTMQGTNEAVERLGQDVSKLTLNADEQVDRAKRERLLQSLKYPGFNERRNEVRKAHPETFQWVFAGDGGTSAATKSDVRAIRWDSFSNWLKSTDTVYWINGKPGSGKSTMVKYILADQKLRQCLNDWSPGCLLISHYFWRPGNPMQRSIKGLYCSLLYQLLKISERVLARVLASATGITTKTEVTDWSVEELQSILLSIVELYDRPICIFLDGLDEVYPDQPTTLLEMIMKFSIAGKIKMCLASRPEPPLQRRLYDMPQLRLQDLTAADLTRYVHDHIRIQAPKFKNVWRYKAFVRSLVERAQGVFLWLVLVTKSVRNGFDNGDSIDIIEERVKHLKGGDLENLYKDMWDRVSGDNPDTYRRTAAHYLRIMLLYIREDNHHLRIYGENLGVVSMMFATTGLAEKILDAAAQPLDLVPEEMLLQRCEEVERIAETYCFGLLEVSQLTDDEIVEDREVVGWYGTDYDQLLVCAQVRRALVFIHRTAVDFLLDTAQGKGILSFDDATESSHAFRLVAANLAQAQLFCDPRRRGPNRGGSFASSHLRSIDWMSKVYTDAHADYTRMMMHFKSLCDFEKLFMNSRTGRVSSCSGVDFFKAVAMYEWNCLSVFEQQIRALDEENLSEILQILCDHFGLFGLRPCGTFIDVDLLRFINLLLLEGADPNWNGTTAFTQAVFLEESEIYRQTPFGAMISRILTMATQWKNDTEFSWDRCTKLLLTLQTFIDGGANLEEKVAIAFHMYVQLSTAESPATFERFAWRPLTTGFVFQQGGGQSPTKCYGYICSVPAHDVLNLLLFEWGPLQQVSNEEHVFAELKSSAEYSAAGHIRMNGTVIGRFEETGSYGSHRRRISPEWRWCVASQEHQDRISNELMSHMTFQESSVDISHRELSAPRQAIGYETLTLILCGPHWVETGLHTRRGVTKYLLEIGLFVESGISSRDYQTIETLLKRKGVLPAT